MNGIAQAEPQGSTAPNMLTTFMAEPIWLLWKSIPNVDPAKKPHKVPYYACGRPRSGELDGAEDRARLVTHAAALAAYDKAAPGTYAGLSLALGPDGRGGCWQGIDLDNMVAAGITDIANLWTCGACAGLGYVEISPSGTGLHLIGYGRPFRSLGANASGIEAYAGGRFFTFTGRPVVPDSSCCSYDLAEYVEVALTPRHAAARPKPTNDQGAGAVRVNAKIVAELRSALAHMRSDDRELWVAMGHALKTLGDTGRGLWFDWSRTSESFDPADAARAWDSFAPRNTGHQAVFAEAMRRGWVDPREAESIRHGAEVAAVLAQAADAAVTAATSPHTFTFEFAMTTDTATLTLDYLLDPWLPMRCVVGFFGRGSTAKSSFLASMAAAISGRASTLWISVEEPDDWIKVRHIRCGGADRTLAVVKAIESKRDKEGRVVASSFNVLADLEPAIEQAKVAFADQQRPPLRLVVLDTAVGLTHWGKGESPNDDAAVKKLLAHLQAWAEKHDLSIALIGHANKGTHDHLADSVMGAAAWTNSPRLSFIHAADRREDHAYVVRTAKTNFEAFGAQYTTEAVHTLYERQGGPDTVLVKVTPGPTVWGSLDSMELFKEATKVPRPDEDGDGTLPSAPKVPEMVVKALIEAVLDVQPGEWTCPGRVESFPEVKGELDDEATAVYEGIRGRGGPAGCDQRAHAARGSGRSGRWSVDTGALDRPSA